MADGPPAVCPICGAPNDITLQLDEIELLNDKRTGIIRAVGRLDRADLSCPNGHELPAAGRLLRITAISMDEDRVITTKLEPRA